MLTRRDEVTALYVCRVLCVSCVIQICVSFYEFTDCVCVCVCVYICVCAHVHQLCVCMSVCAFIYVRACLCEGVIRD